MDDNWNSDSGFVEFEDIPANERNFGGHVIVYCLVDPRDDTARYVGVTSKTPEARLREHLEHPTNLRTRKWFGELRSAGLEPEVEILQRVHANWQVAEMEWIAWFRVRGDLLNVDDGGILYESGSGWDEVKLQKSLAIYETALADCLADRPPPCARDHRSEHQKRRDFTRIRRAMDRGQRMAAARAEKAKIAARENSQASARSAVSIEPQIRRKGTGKPREDRGRHADITPRDALGGAREQR